VLKSCRREQEELRAQAEAEELQMRDEPEEDDG